MSNVYCIKTYKIKKRIRELNELLKTKQTTGRRLGFFSMEQFHVFDIHREISDLTKQLKVLEENAHENPENKDD